MDPHQPPGDRYPTMPGSVDPDFQRYSYTSQPEQGQVDEYRAQERRRAYEPAGRKVLRIGRYVTLGLLALQLLYFAGLWLYTHFS